MSKYTLDMTYPFDKRLHIDRVKTSMEGLLGSFITSFSEESRVEVTVLEVTKLKDEKSSYEEKFKFSFSNFIFNGESKIDYEQGIISIKGCVSFLGKDLNDLIYSLFEKELDKLDIKEEAKPLEN